MGTSVFGLIGTGIGLFLFLLEVTINWHFLKKPAERNARMPRLLLTAFGLIEGFLLYWSLGMMTQV
jgi:hypothetical protein